MCNVFFLFFFFLYMPITLIQCVKEKHHSYKRHDDISAYDDDVRKYLAHNIQNNHIV